MDKVWKLERITNKEYRSVVAYHIVIAFFCVLNIISSQSLQLYSSLTNLIANPLGSRSQSAEPFSPPTVEKRAKTGVRLPILFKNFALQYFVTSCVTSK
jgi:hypothetical protein